MKRICLTFSWFIILSCNIFTQGQTPIISNVEFAQPADGTYNVDVFYDLSLPDNNPVAISMEVSSDNGGTWKFSCDLVTGDIGPNITGGTRKHIVWEFAKEHPNIYSRSFVIKIKLSGACKGINSVNYAGKFYHTVSIGDQCWLKENLDVGTMIPGGTDQKDNSIIEKYCYNNDPSNCAIYGGLYQWDEAMQYTLTEGTQGICPDDWHLPTEEELAELLEQVCDPEYDAATSTWVCQHGGNALKEIGQGIQNGSGTNTSGFSALLGGRRLNDGSFGDMGKSASFRSTTLWNNDYPYGLQLVYDSDNASIHPIFALRIYGWGFRCLKNN